MGRLVKAIVTYFVMDFAIDSTKKAIKAIKHHNDVKKAEEEIERAIKDEIIDRQDATITEQREHIEELKREIENLKNKQDA